MFINYCTDLHPLAYKQYNWLLIITKINMHIFRRVWCRLSFGTLVASQLHSLTTNNQNEDWPWPPVPNWKFSRYCCCPFYLHEHPLPCIQNICIDHSLLYEAVHTFAGAISPPQLIVRCEIWPYQATSLTTPMPMGWSSGIALVMLPLLTL